MKDIKKALKNGEVVIGVCCDISDPSVVAILGYTGWGYVIINCEGGVASPFGAELENLIRAAYIADITPVVKVPENDSAMVASAVNLGAKIVEVPKVNTKEDAIEALKAAKYPPQGNRMTCWGGSQPPSTEQYHGQNTSSKPMKRYQSSLYWKNKK